MTTSVRMFVMALLLASCSPQLSDPSRASETITMAPSSATPDPVTVEKGETVCWVNADTVNRWPASNIHPTHGIYPEFDPRRALLPGETWCFRFGQRGIWKYHDHLYPEITGTVNVE